MANAATLAPVALNWNTPLRWGASGHRIIARVASELLSPAAHRMVRELLGDESLADASTWADEIRGSRRYTAPWHYVNIPLADSVWNPGRYCQRGCVVSTLEKEREILADQRASERERREALKWVVHLTGDISAPLHAGDRGDRGGNDLKVTWEGRRTNLHRLWDGMIMRASGRDEDEWVDFLLQRIEDRPVLAESLATGTPAEWAMDSHDIARVVVYRFLPNTLRLDDSYYQRTHGALERQLMAGGVRLAAELNRVAR